MTQATGETSPPRQRDVSWRKQLVTYVGGKIGLWQAAYLDPKRRALGAGWLANLRHSATQPPGASPATWTLEFDGFPEALIGRGDDPSAAEWAAHLAFTLYATHQQSQTEPMHRVGRQHGLGAAVRRLAWSGPDAMEFTDKLPSRFAALGTATQPDEIAHYSRMIVRQLGSATPPIPLDYATLAGQLLTLQDPARADGVRLQWGREFAGWRPESPKSTAPTSTEETKKGI